MFILFGWGFKTNKVFGAKNERCPVCADESVAYIRSRTWFTLFFIPIIPYATNYLKVCNRCNSSCRMEKEPFFQEFEKTNQPLPSPFPDLSDVAPETNQDLPMNTK